MPAVAFTDEMLHYYSKLLSLRAAVLIGDQNAAASVDTRFKIIVPESVKVFAVCTRLDSLLVRVQVCAAAAGGPGPGPGGCGPSD